MLLLFIKAEQFGLFDQPTNISGYVTRHGTVVAPHVGIRKVTLNKPVAKPKPAPAAPEPTGDLFSQGLDDLPGVHVEHAKPEPKAGPTEGERLLDDLRAKLSDLAGRAMNTGVKGSGDLSGRIRSFTMGMKATDPLLTRKWVDDVVAEREKMVRKLEKQAHEAHQRTAATRAPAPAPAPEPTAERDMFEEPTGELEAPVAQTAGGTEVRFELDGGEFQPAGPGDYSVPFENIPVEPFGVPAGISKGKRRDINAAVVELVKRDGDSFSDDELAKLRQYSGNGGCGDSLNEFYTDSRVAAAMWKVLHGLGLPAGAQVLEPSCGTGVFMHTAPAGVKVVGVELDGVSSKVASILHGRNGHEVNTGSLESFATTDARQFDAVVGNPPFGPRGSLAAQDKKDLSTAQQYFVDTSIDKCKSGGIVALVVPTGIMDSKGGRAFRERCLRKAEFLGALRMPNTAFEHSHTDVTTDVVFFRKRPQDVAGALMTVPQGALKNLGVWDDEFLAGTYFEGRGAENVLGTMEAGWRAKAGMGDDITVNGSMAGVPEAIARFRTAGGGKQCTLDDVLAALGTDEKAKARAITGSLKTPYQRFKVGDTKVEDGVTYVLRGKPPRWHRIDEAIASPAVTAAQSLAADIDRVIKERDELGMSDTEIQRTLADRVRTYIDEHGNPSKNRDLLVAASQNKVLFRLIGAVRPDGTLSDVVENRTRETSASLDTIAQALALEHGFFTPEELAARWSGGDVDAVRDQLFASDAYALLADGTWTTADEFLSGELWPKVDQITAALKGDLPADVRAKYEAQAKSLMDTIDPKSLEDVEVLMNSGFVPLHVVEAYWDAQLEELRAKNPGSSYYSGMKPMKITFADSRYSVSGGMYGHDLLEKWLNRDGVRKDDLPTIDGWNHDFKEWLLSSRYRDEVEDAYNRKFRGFRQRAYSEKPMDIPGLVGEPKSYQFPGLRWPLENGKGIIAADVGLGKTVRGLMLARMAKITGQAKKPIIVVPKSVLANWVAEVEKWFPGTRVLTIGETYSKDKDGNLRSASDSEDVRNRKWHDLTQNDYDFVLVSEPAFEKVDLDPISKWEYVQRDFWVQRGEKKGNEGSKEIKRMRENYEQAVAKRDIGGRDDALYFNHTGVDMIIADEMHHQKNLYAARPRFGESPKFLGGSGLSNRSLDFNLKSRSILDANGGKNVYGLTATPTKNSPLEIYNMLSHIAPEAFTRIGIRNSEEFIDRYCRFEERAVTLGVDGSIKPALCVVGFKNMGELRDLMRRYIDRKTAADVGLELPTRDDRMHLFDMSDAQKTTYASLRAQYEELQKSKSKDATGEAHIFSIMDRMAKAAMDLKLLDESSKEESPKYNEVAKTVLKHKDEGGQIIFADYVDAHERIADALVKAGVPRNRIAIINGKTAPTSAKRQNFADDFNAGKYDAVIGNTPIMGEGMNLQKRTTDIHHLDLPWEPASMQQRNGRGLRQGNTKKSVRLHTYVGKGTFDGYRYQSMTAKKDWQDLLWTGGDNIENLNLEGNFNRDELMIMMSADPEAAMKDYQSNKALAKEKYEAGQRAEQAEKFIRFQSMSRSLGAMKNKGSASAARLANQVEGLRAQLKASPYFRAKHVLDKPLDVFVHPETGEAFESNTGFELKKDGTGSMSAGKYVITGISTERNGNPVIMARRYGATSGHSLHFSPSDLKEAARFDYSNDDEEGEAAAQFAAHAAEALEKVTSPMELRDLPAKSVRDNYEAIQTRLRTLTKEYKSKLPGDHSGSAKLAMFRKDGAVVSFNSYDVRKDDVLDSHDIPLPLPEHREKLERAYIDMEKGKRYSSEMLTSSGRSKTRHLSTTSYTIKAKYPGDGYVGSTENPIAATGKALFGDEFEKQARARFESEALAAARHEKDMREVMRHLIPTIAAGRYSSGNVFSRRTLATMWAKAKQLGALDKQVREVMPENTDRNRSSWDNKLHTPAILGLKSTYSNSSEGSDRTLRQTIIDLAKGSPATKDLASVFVVDSSGDAPTKSTLSDLSGLRDTWSANDGYHGYGLSSSMYRYHPTVLDAIEHAAKKMGVYHERLGSPSLQGIHFTRNKGGEQTLAEWVAQERENRDGSKL